MLFNEKEMITFCEEMAIPLIDNRRGTIPEITKDLFSLTEDDITQNMGEWYNGRTAVSKTADKS